MYEYILYMPNKCSCFSCQNQARPGQAVRGLSYQLLLQGQALVKLLFQSPGTSPCQSSVPKSRDKPLSSFCSIVQGQALVKLLLQSPGTSPCQASVPKSRKKPLSSSCSKVQGQDLVKLLHSPVQEWIPVELISAFSSVMSYCWPILTLPVMKSVTLYTVRKAIRISAI